MRKKLLLISAIVLIAVFLAGSIANTHALDVIIISNSVTINGGADTTYSLSVTLTLTQGLFIIGTPPIVSMRFTNYDPATLDAWLMSTWEPWSATTQWTLLAGGAGGRTVWAEYLLQDGTVSTPFSDSITYSPLIVVPIVTVDSVTINGGAATTYSLDVTLTLTTALRVFNQAVVSMSFANAETGMWIWTAWEPWASTKAWILSSGAGTKTVNARYQLRDGTITDYFSDSITYEGDFTVSASPASRTITAGQSTTYDVVAIPGGYPGFVAWSCAGNLPTGFTASFNPTTVDPNHPNTSTMTVTTTTQSEPGTYQLDIQGAGTVGGLVHDKYVTLTILPPPDFSVSASPASQTINQGQSTTYTVNVGSVGGFSTGVSLSVTGLPTGATGSFSPSSVTPTGTSTLTVVTTSQTPAGTYTLTITGTAGTTTHSTTVTLVVNSVTSPPPSPDFSVSASPASQTINQGQSTSYTVNVGSVGGFSTAVSLRVTGLPTGATGSFSPSSVTPTGTSTLTVTTTSQTPAGTSTLTITGTAGALSHSATATLVVSSASQPPASPDFSVSASSPAGGIVVSQGQSTSYGVSVASVGGFSSGVSLSVAGMPSGVAVSFSPSTVTPTGTSTLTVATTSQTPAGTYTLTVTGTAGALSHSATATLVVTVSPPPSSADFSVSASPVSQSVSQGQSTNYGVTVASVGGFSSGVSLSVTGLPTGATGVFSPSSVTPTGTSTLTVTTTSQTPAGTSTLTITGTAGTTTHSATATLVVTVSPPPSSADFSVSASPASGSAVQGLSASYAVTVTSIGGFSASVSLSVAGLPAGATGTFGQSPVSPTGTSTLTVSTTGATPNGTYSLTISGTGSGLTRQTTVTLAVLPTEIEAPTKTSSTVTLSVSPTEFSVGSDVVLKGSISPVREGVIVTIEYLSSGGSWNTLATVITSVDGSFTYIWKPSDEGTYLVRAGWGGDVTTLSSESQSVTLQASAQGQAFPLWVLGAVIIVILVVTGAAVIIYSSRRRDKSSSNSPVFRSAPEIRWPD